MDFIVSLLTSVLTRKWALLNAMSENLPTNFLNLLNILSVFHQSSLHQVSLNLYSLYPFFMSVNCFSISSYAAWHWSNILSSMFVELVFVQVLLKALTLLLGAIHCFLKRSLFLKYLFLNCSFSILLLRHSLSLSMCCSLSVGSHCF